MPLSGYWHVAGRRYTPCFGCYPNEWKDERPPIDLMRYIIEGTKEQREAMRAAAQEEEVSSMFRDIRYERPKKP